MRQKRTKIQPFVSSKRSLLPSTQRESEGTLRNDVAAMHSTKGTCTAEWRSSDCIAGYLGKERPLKISKKRETAVQTMYDEFQSKRIISLSAVSLTFSMKEYLEDLKVLLKHHSHTVVSGTQSETVKLLFPSTDVAQSALSCIKSSLAVVERRVLATFLRHSISMLFVGNLPYTFEREDLRSLFEPFGNVARCFVVCSVRTGLSKGYGFVELATVEQAREAKVKMANKLLGNRGLRVDFADSGIQTSSDLHSQTLFVDRLPMEVMESRVSCLKEMFGKFGTVSFCQVALTDTGQSRGFAFVDMASSKEAEEAQLRCNGAHLLGQAIRVSYGMPCRPGACILHQKSSTPVLPPLCTNHFQTHVSNGIGTVPLHPIHVPVACVMDPFQVSESKENLPLICYEPSPVSLFFNSSTGPPPPPPPACLSSTLPPPPHHHQQQYVICKSTAELMGFQVADAQYNNNNSSFKPPLIPPVCKQFLYSTYCIQEPSRKRHLPTDEEDPVLKGASTQPYIGQHQQGIPYLHPLKRICSEDHVL